MGDILSQSEIDELLKALNTGELDVQNITTAPEERKIRKHDFRRPSKFAKDHIKTRNVIHDNYARLLSNFLSGYLRTLVQIQVISVEAIAYYEFNNSISIRLFWLLLIFHPYPDRLFLKWPRRLLMF